MNVAFTRLIKLQGLNREFNFRKLNGTPVHYHVDVTDERGQRILFQIEKKNDGEWKANIPHVPKWCRTCHRTRYRRIHGRRRMIRVISYLFV